MATPIQLPVTAQTDASGNATISKVIRAAYWTAVYATAQCQGTAAWVLGPAGTAIAFQEGANVVLGPIFVGPGESAQLQVAGATPNTPVTVTFWGFQGAAQDGSDLPPLVPSVETAGSLLGIVGPVTIGGNVPVLNASGTQLQTKQDQVLLGTLTVNPGDNSKQVSYPLPAGTHGLMAVCYSSNDAAGGVPLSYFTVIGGISGIEWINYSGGVQTPSVPVGVVASAIENQVTITASMPSSSAHPAYIALVALLDTLVVENSSSSVPPPWQAPDKSAGAVGTAVNLAASASLVLIGGLTGERIYLHDFDIGFVAAPALDVFLDAGAGTNPIAMFANNATEHITRSGLALPAGAPLRINNQSGAAQSFTWAATYSQA